MINLLLGCIIALLASCSAFLFAIMLNLWRIEEMITPWYEGDDGDGGIGYGYDPDDDPDSGPDGGEELDLYYAPDPEEFRQQLSRAYYTINN